MKYSILLFTVCLLATQVLGQKAGLMLPVGHDESITAMSVSPNGQLIASADREGRIIIWSVASAQEQRTITEKSRFVRSITFSPKTINDPIGGKYLVSGGEDRQLTVWETATGKEVLSFPYKSYVESIAFSPNGENIIAATGDDVHIIDFSTGSTVRTLLGHTKDVMEAAYSPDGNQILTGSQDALVKLWDTNTGALLHDFEGHEDDVEHVAFGPGGKYILTGDEEGNVILWDITKKTEKSRIWHRFLKEVKFDPLHQAIWTLGLGGIKKWDYEGNELTVFDAWKSGSGRAFEFIPQQERLILSTYNSIVLVDKKEGAELRRCTGLVGSINQIHITPNGQEAVIYGLSGNIASWDLRNGRLLNVFKSKHPSSVTCTALSPITKNDAVGGRYFLTGSRDKTIKLWDTHTGDLLNTFKGHTGALKGVSFSADGKQIISSSNDYTWKIWNVSTGSVIKSVETRPGSPEKVLFSPNGKHIVSSHSDNVIRIWDSYTGAEVRNIPCIKDIIDLKMSPVCKDDPEGGKYLIAYNMDNTHVWDSNTGEELTELRSTSTRNGFIDFMPDGKRVILSGAKMIRLYDITTGEKLHEHKTDEAFKKATFDSSGDFGVLLNYDDDFARLFDLSTWSEKVSFVVFDNAKDWLYVTPDKYYYGTKEASKSIHYTVDDNLYSFDQFDLQYNRPDIIIKRMGLASQNLIGAYKGAYIKRLSKMGFSQPKISKFVNGEFDKKLNAPVLKIDDQFLNVETKKKAFNFSIEANDPAGVKINQLLLSINGVPLYGAKGKMLSHTPGTILKTDIQGITLSNGKNTIRVQVINDNGVASLSQSIEVLYTGEPSASNLFIVAIGVSKYQDSEMNLDFAAKDAGDIAKLFSEQKGKYENINVYSYVDEDATTANILAVKEKLQQSNVDDHVVLFVAGHGLLDDNLDYFIATHDVNFMSPAAKGLRYEDLEGLLDEIPARNKLMLIDACHSGEVDKEETVLTATVQTSTSGVKSRGFKNKTPQKMGLAESFELMQKLFNDLRAGNGAVVISAASGVEFSLESNEWNNGVFTYSLLEGLKTAKADSDANQKVNVSELQDYVFQRVTELTNGKQHPTSRRDNLENDFVVW